MKRVLIIGANLCLLLLLSVATVTNAQETCTAQIQLALSRAFGTCQGVEPNTLCYGSGDVAATFQTADIEDIFTQIGDQTRIEPIESVSLVSSTPDRWSTAFFRLRANLDTSSQRSVLGIAFGDVALRNLIETVPQSRAIPLGMVMIREIPDMQAEIIGRVGINGEVIVNGVNESETWLRVRVPNSDQLGWISTEIVTLEDESVMLNTVNVDTTLPQPFELFTISASADQICAEAPASGVLLQTPNLEDPVQLNINGTDMTFTGTVLLTASDDGSISASMLEGIAILVRRDAIARLTAGAQVGITDDGLNVLPYTQAIAALSPTLYLERRVQLPDALTAEAIADLQTQPMVMVQPETEPAPQVCTYRVIGDQNLRTGPGLDTGVARGIEAGALVFPRGQVNDTQGQAWVQVGEQAWIRATALATNGECDPIPTIETDFVTASRVNTLPLEECQPSNGPIRVGQRVTLTFVPPAWENYPAALNATRAGRGIFLVQDTYLYPRVSAPVRISDNEFIRQFSAEWTAELGTYRIEGSYFAYEAICTVTVVQN